MTAGQGRGRCSCLRLWAERFDIRLLYIAPRRRQPIAPAHYYRSLYARGLDLVEAWSLAPLPPLAVPKSRRLRPPVFGSLSLSVLLVLRRGGFGWAIRGVFWGFRTPFYLAADCSVDSVRLDFSLFRAWRLRSLRRILRRVSLLGLDP